MNEINQQVAEVLEKHDLFWEVQSQPLQFPDGVKAGFQGTRRMDRKQDGAMGSFKSYTPFQNWELVELILRVGENFDTEIENVGQFDDGAKLYFQMPASSYRFGSNDTVKSYITAINSHDGSTRLRWGIATEVISCRNTFQSAYGQLQNSIMHTKSMKQKVEETISYVEKAKEAEQTMMERFLKMTEMPTSAEEVAKVVNLVTGIDTNMKPSELQDNFSTKKINSTNELMASIEAEIKSKGANKWGLFNGVTHFTTHKLGRTEDNREKSKVLGANLKIDNKVLELLSI